MSVPSHILRSTLVASALLLAGCGLAPSAGPTKAQLFSSSVQQDGDAFVIAVDDRVNRITASKIDTGFSAQFRNAGLLGADTIMAGDRLDLIVWENVDSGLLNNPGQTFTPLTQLTVDESGSIFVPYAGRIYAAGKTPDAVRRIITNKLGEATRDPQVQVMRTTGSGASVTIMGNGGGQGVVPITRNSRRLSQVIASAGGIISNPVGTRISINRNNANESIFFDDLINNPRLDIAVRDGDRIVIEADQRSFTVMGATGAQTELQFKRDRVTTIEAIAQVGGLQAATADPTGVFVLRNETEAVVEALTGQDVDGPRRVLYVFDLTKPNGMFMARDFLIRDRDTVYVSEAPIVQFNRVIASFTGSLSSTASLGSAINSFGN